MVTPTAPSGPFTVGETHGRALRSGNQLLTHSQDAGWRSLYAASFREVPFQARESALGHPSLIYHLSHPTTVTRKVEGATRERSLIGPRRFCLTPGSAATEWEHAGHPEILQIYLRRAVYDEAVREAHGRVDGADLQPRFAVVDPLLEQLALAVLTALRDGTVEDGLYVDTIAQMMAVHLVRYHSNGNRARLALAARLPSARVRRLVDYIESHLGDDLSLQRLAAEAEVSPLYLPRAFREAVGQAPHRYVLDRRVERAKALLRDTEMSVVEVALETGFSSQSHLSAWFVRLVGATPAAYRRSR